MITVFGFTIMRSSTYDAYRNVVAAAWDLHEKIWFDQQNDFSALIGLDQALSDALSRVPIEDAPK